MNQSTPIHHFHKRWRHRLLLRCFLQALVAGMLLLFVLLLWFSVTISAVAAFAAGSLVFLLLWRRYRLLTERQVAHWLDLQYPQLQYSTGLLLAVPEALSLPARLQRKQTEEKLSAVLAELTPPVALAGTLAALAVICLSGMLLLAVWQPKVSQLLPRLSGKVAPATEAARQQQAELRRMLPRLEQARMRLAPPAYTGKAAAFHPLSDVRVPEGSYITWQLEFNEAVTQVFLANQQNDTLELRKTAKGAWVAQLQAKAPLFYRIGYASPTDTAFSSFLKIEVQPDAAPDVQILAPEQYQLAQEGMPFTVSVEARDDYGLEDVYLSLTISRGSGEGVDFREEKVWIELAAGAREVRKELTLSPKRLNMQPGDELYYRLEAFDNKPPTGQRRRSNTWFYQWQDTAATTSMLSSGLALEVEPEYFRSQRQIIIDTEKLISTQASTPVASWEKANQNLAIDQKLLRLRYGKFLGEEFESGIVAIDAPEEEAAEEHEEHDQEAEYGNELHEHDLPGHEEPATAAPAAGLLEMFGHAHDTEEGATFYEERIKVKLKAALAEMWEAEKYLRLSEPRKALPYEYRALKIIKEVQQSTRVYVERVGLELPTLIPQEHRLKGEQEAILPQPQVQAVSAADTLAATRHLLARLSFWRNGDALTASEQQLVRTASKELARLLLQEGPYLQYFYLLNSLNTLLQEQPPAVKEVRKIVKGLYQLLPRQKTATAPAQLLNPLQKSFLETTGSLHEN